MQLLDWVVVAAYFGLIALVGYRTGRGNRGIEDYFLARRSMPWYAMGLSVMATQASAITLVGATGQAYADGMRFLQIYLGLPIAMVLLSVTFVPLFYRARVFTAYQYLEERCGPGARTLTSLLFLFGRALSGAVVIYAPSVVLSVVFSLDETLTILLIGGFATLYTALGGMRAVMWVETWQMLIILLGILFCFGSVVSGLPEGVGFGEALRLAGAAGRLETLSFDPDPRQTYTVWTGLLGGLFLMLSYFGCDQSQVQRYLTGRSLRESRISLLFNGFAKLPVQFVILLTGALLFVFYQFEKPPLLFDPATLAAVRAESPAELARTEADYDRAFAERREAAFALAAADGEADGEDGPEGAARERFLTADRRFRETREEARQAAEAVRGEAWSDTNHVFPAFVFTQLPAGLVGLILIAVLAAAMSTVESELSALSTASVVDFYRRFGDRLPLFRPGSGPGAGRRLLAAGRAGIVFWGALATGAALYMGRLGSAVEAVNRVGSFFYGPILGAFLLAALLPNRGARRAVPAIAAGVAAVWAVELVPRALGAAGISYLYYNLVGAGVTVAVGRILSGATPSAAEEAPRP